MSYQVLIDKLRKERDKIAKESHDKIEKINLALTALADLNGNTFEALETKVFAEPVIITHAKKPKAALIIKKHERAGDVLRRIGMHYRDVAIDAARKAGRPVTTEEVFAHLKKLSGKNLNRKAYMSRIGVVLRYDSLHGNIGQTKVPGSNKSLWNALTAADLQKQEIVSADIK